MIHTRCATCQVPLSFSYEQAEATGPCFQCGHPVTVPAAPPITVVCGHCHAPSQFARTQLGQSGPCRHCGQTITVQEAPAPTATSVQESPTPPATAVHAVPNAPTNQRPSVPPTPTQQKVLARVEKEVTKAGFSIQGTRNVQLDADVTTGEAIGDALKARFMPFGASIRTDRVLGVTVGGTGGGFLLTIPFSGKLMLAHEFASIVPGTLPSNLWLERGLLGDWSSGHYLTEHGDEDPVATAAEDDFDINDGIIWDWENGNSKIKLRWGLQAVPASSDSTLLVIQTAQLGIIRRNFGITWFPKRHAALQRFMANFHSTSAPPHPRFQHEPYSTLFADML